MGVETLDKVLVPIGLLVFVAYHIWLVYTVKRNPRNTVIGLNTETHHQWVSSLMADPLKNGVLAIQTLCNNMMASTVLATTAITMSSIVIIFASHSASTTSSMLVYGDKSERLSAAKYFTVLICFLTAFLCNVESLRYYAQVSFLITSPKSQNSSEAIEYAARCLNRGSLFWSFGLRAFYLSFPLFLWIFGPIPMFVCSCVMSILLYYLDTTTKQTRKLHFESLKVIKLHDEVESHLPL